MPSVDVYSDLARKLARRYRQQNPTALDYAGLPGAGLIRTVGSIASGVGATDVGQSMSDYVDERVNPGAEEGLLGQTLEGAGSTLPFMLAAPVGAAAELLGAGPTVAAGLTTATVAGLGVAAEKGGAYQQAKAAGASDEQATTASWLVAPIGLTEIIPGAKWAKTFGGVLKRVDKASGGAVEDVVRRGWKEAAKAIAKAAAVDGLEEAGQETIQQYWENLIASEVHSPDEATSLLEAAKVAPSSFLVGALFGAASKYYSRKYGEDAPRLQGPRQSPPSGAFTIPPPRGTQQAQQLSTEQPGTPGAPEGHPLLTDAARAQGESVPGPSTEIQEPDEPTKAAVERFVRQPAVGLQTGQKEHAPVAEYTLHEAPEHVQERAAKVGARVVYVDAGGQLTAPGFFDDQTNTIVIDRNAGQEEQDGSLLEHELVHFTKANHPEVFDANRAAIEAVAPGYLDRAAASREGRQRAATPGAPGPVLTGEVATEEAVAETVQSIPSYLRLAREAPELAARIATYRPGLIRSIADTVIDFAHKVGLAKHPSVRSAIKGLRAAIEETGTGLEKGLGPQHGARLALKLQELHRAMLVAEPVAQPKANIRAAVENSEINDATLPAELPGEEGPAPPNPRIEALRAELARTETAAARHTAPVGPAARRRKKLERRAAEIRSELEPMEAAQRQAEPKAVGDRVRLPSGEEGTVESVDGENLRVRVDRKGPRPAEDTNVTLGLPAAKVRTVSASAVERLTPAPEPSQRVAKGSLTTLQALPFSRESRNAPAKRPLPVRPTATAAPAKARLRLPFAPTARATNPLQRAIQQVARRQTRYMGNKRDFVESHTGMLAGLSRAHLQDVATVFDVYAGGGTYGLSLVASGMTPKATRLVINEVDPVRRTKLELSMKEGGDFLAEWDTNKRLAELRAQIEPLIVRSSTPAASALDQMMRTADFGSLPARAKAALLAVRDVMFSGRTADWEKLRETAATDADRIKRLAERARAQSVVVTVKSLDALGPEAKSLVSGGGRSLVLLDPPYHETASGNYSAGGASYEFASKRFLDANVAAAKAMSPGNVVLYHNKATAEVQSATRAAFGAKLADQQWQRRNGQQEYVGVFDGQGKGVDAGLFARDVRPVAEGQGADANAGVLGQARSDAGRPAGRGPATGTDGGSGSSGRLALPLRRKDELGFYSRLEELAQTLPEKTTGVAALGKLKAQASAEELRYSGLEEFLKKTPKVTREQIAAFLVENGVGLKEIELTGRDKARFEQFTVPGGTYYRELLLTLPSREYNARARRFAEKMGINNIQEAYRRYAETEEGAHPSAHNDDFAGGHYSQPNVVAFMRVDNRIGPNGEKVLFVEEIQSDWHQKGREQGYRGDQDPALIAEALKREESARIALSARLKEEDYLGFDSASEAIRAIASHPDYHLRFDMTPEAGSLARHWKNTWTHLQDVQNGGGGGRVPDAPFKETWEELAMKRVLLYAAQRGYDTVAWTKSGEQIDRYNTAMRKNVDKIEVEPRKAKRLDPIRHFFQDSAGKHYAAYINEDGAIDRTPPMNSEQAAREWVAEKLGAASKDDHVYVRAHKDGQEMFGAAVPVNGTTSLHGHEVDLADVIGKDMARKVREAPGETHLFEGEGLAIGGKGMQAAYDQRLPAIAKKLTKNEVVPMTFENEAPEDDEDMGPGYDVPEFTAHSVAVPVEKIKEEGFARFALPLRQRLPMMSKGRIADVTGRYGADNEERQTARTSKRENVREFQAGVRAVRLDTEDVQTRESAYIRAVKEIKADSAGLRERLLEKYRSRAILDPWEQVAMSRLADRAAEKMYRSQSHDNIKDATLLRWVYEDMRAQTARALGVIRDAFQEWGTGVDALSSLLAVGNTKTRKKLKDIQTRLDTETLTGDGRLALGKQMEALAAEEARVTAKVMKKLREAGLDPNLVTLDYFHDPVVFSRAARIASTTKSGARDMFLEWRIASMLGGPMTQVGNFSGNSASLFYKDGLRPLAEALVNVAVRDQNGATFGELVPYYRAWLPGLAQAGHNFMLAMRTEMPAFEVGLSARGVAVPGYSTRMDFIEAGHQAIPGAIGRVLRFPSTTMLLAFDEFFKTLSAHTHTVGHAYREAKGDEAHMARLLADPEWAGHLAGLQHAREITFQDADSKVLQGLLSIRRSIDDTFKLPVASMVFPFVKTPFRIFQRGLELPFAPALAVKHWADGTWKEKPGAKTRDIADAVLGLGVTLAVAAMIYGDKDDDDQPLITGSASTDPNERAQQERTAPPMSFRLNGHYYQYTRLDPISIGVAQLVDTITKAKQKGSIVAGLGAGAASILNQAEDRTFLRGLGDLMKVIQESRSERDASGATVRWARDTLVTPMVPNILKAPLRATTPERTVSNVRKYDDATVWQAGARSIPGAVLPLRALQPPVEYGLWGEDMLKPGRSYGARLFSPVPETGEPDVSSLSIAIGRYNDKVASGAIEDGKPFLPSLPEYSYVENKERHQWTDEQYSRLLRDAGRMAANDLLADRTINLRDPDADDMKTFAAAISRARKTVRDRILSESLARK